MRKNIRWMIAFLAVGFVMMGAPKDADAALRLGVDALWIPLGFQTLESGGTKFDTEHEMGSGGLSAHAAFGFDILAVGLKVNYFNQAISFPGGDERFEEIDFNLYGRVGFPTTDLAVFAEVGLSTNPGFDYAGYNMGAGLTYDLLGMPLLDFNIGAMGQYVNVSESNLDIGEDVSKPSLSQGRVMLFLGIDFSI